MKLKAIIFDVDGTIAETEEVHRVAFNRAFGKAGHNWLWSIEDYRKLLKITGGRERIRHFVDSIGADVTNAQIAEMHGTKNAIYAELVQHGAAVLRPGIARLIAEARDAGVRMAIATTTSRTNLMALFEQHFGANWPEWFDAVITGEDVVRKKPDPQVYSLALEALGLEAGSCIAIEDSYNGLIAASTCEIPVLVTPSRYTSHEHFEGAAMLCASLDDPAYIDVAALDGLLSSLQPVAAAR